MNASQKNRERAAVGLALQALRYGESTTAQLKTLIACCDHEIAHLRSLGPHMPIWHEYRVSLYLEKREEFESRLLQLLTYQLLGETL